jgi:hypothetical protein
LSRDILDVVSYLQVCNEYGDDRYRVEVRLEKMQRQHMGTGLQYDFIRKVLAQRAAVAKEQCVLEQVPTGVFCCETRSKHHLKSICGPRRGRDHAGDLPGHISIASAHVV